MTVLTTDVVQAKINSGDYWVLEVLADEWLYVISRIIKDYYQATGENKKPRGEMLYVQGDGSTLFILEKKQLSARELADRLGADQGNIEDCSYIVLWPLEDDKQKTKLSKPTVNYTGSA